AVRISHVAVALPVDVSSLNSSVPPLLLVLVANGTKPPEPEVDVSLTTRPASRLTCGPSGMALVLKNAPFVGVAAGVLIPPLGLMFVVVTKILTPAGMLLKVAFKRVPKSARPAVPPTAEP